MCKEKFLNGIIKLLLFQEKKMQWLRQMEVELDLLSALKKNFGWSNQIDLMNWLKKPAPPLLRKVVILTISINVVVMFLIEQYLKKTKIGDKA